MRLLAQQFVACRVGFMSLRQRLGPSSVIVVGMGCVIGVSLSMLSLTAGLVRTFSAAGDSRHAIVYPADATDEYGTGLSRSSVGIILNAPGIAVDPAGKPLASAEVLEPLAPAEGFSEGTLMLRGLDPQAPTLMPGFTVVSGRMFRSGARELIVGRGAESEFGLQVGSSVILPDGEWPIVGEFTASGSFVESQLLGDAETIMSVVRIPGYGGVLVALKSPAAFAEFKRWLTANPALAVTVERQSDYLRRTGSRYSRFFTTMAYIIGCAMAMGALFGSMQIMYSTVEARTREMATLRAIGYGPLPIAVAVLLETIFLSLIGALLGAVVAWLLFNGKQAIRWDAVFRLYVSGKMVAFGLGAAAFLAVLGGLMPAIRAARSPVSQALRAE
jgi:putative ABC transport system permease protein